MSIAYRKNTSDLITRTENNNAYSEIPFTFDLEQMKKAVDAPVHIPPRNLTREELRAWMKSKATNASL
ncbi:MAG: hypothetical protein GQ582_02085 [Methyloprofundus sp.]|nr:hypothetical protein [Methyloprofundus sp.]